MEHHKENPFIYLVQAQRALIKAERTGKRGVAKAGARAPADEVTKTLLDESSFVLLVTVTFCLLSPMTLSRTTTI